MIQFNFSISNPWHKDNFKNLYHKDWAFKNHKAVAIQFAHYDYDLFDISANLTFRQDHAGLVLNFCVFGYSINFSFYDTRHWDYENKRWETYDNDNINS